MLLAAIGYLLITALIFHNLLPVLTTHLFGDLGDPLLNTSILAWNAKHLPLTTDWWNFPAFAPLSGVTAFTEHLLGAYPLTSPIIWISGNPVLAYNALQLLTLPLNGLAAFALVRELTGSSIAAFIGGLAFAFAPFTGEHASHIQMLMAFGMPLALYGLHRYVRSGAPRDLVWFAVGWLSVTMSNAYMLIFFPILIAVWAIWFFERADARRWVAVMVAGGIATLPVLPLLIGYHLRQAAYGLFRDYPEIVSQSAGIQSLAGINQRAVFWVGWLPNTFYEQSLFPGFAIIALVVVAVAAAFRSREHRPWRRVVLGYLAAAIVLWTFTLGPELRWAGVHVAPARAILNDSDGPNVLFGPYWLLMHVPGLQSIRVPSRAWLPATLCLAVCAGFGAAWLAARRRTRWVIVPVAVLVVAEGWFVGPAMRTPSALPLYIPPGAQVLDLPISAGYGNADAQYLAVRGGYRVVNGYSGYAPPYFGPLRNALADHRPEAFVPFRQRAALYIVARPDLEPQFVTWLESLPDPQRVIDFGKWKLYRLPRLGNNPPASALLPLPRPGEIPLSIPER
jgi:hypothetical protein